MIALPRRHWLAAALALAMAGPRAQALPRIVWVWPGSASGDALRSAAFKQGMRDIGLLAGQHYLLEEHYVDGRYERFAGLMDEVLKRPPAVLMVVTIASVQAAQRATRSVPIVFVTTNDPLGSGLVASLARPGGNTTGLSTQNEDTAIKNLQMLHEILPRARRVAALVNPLNPSGPKIFEQLRNAALALGVELTAFPAQTPQALEAATVAIARHAADALMVIPDAVFYSERERLTAFALKQRLPYFGTNREATEAGGLLSYGQSVAQTFRRSALYVKKILDGARPADLPVEQPTHFELIINLKTAAALGLTIPPSVLLRADEVLP